MSARVRRGAGIAITLVLVGLWVVLLRPQALGGPLTYLVVRGDSMEPTYHSGDLVILRSAPAYATREIVAYRVPAGEVGAGHLVVHRITGGDGDAGFLMQGDNNPSVDPWMPRSSDIAGEAWILLPGAGRILHLPAQPGGGRSARRRRARRLPRRPCTRGSERRARRLGHAQAEPPAKQGAASRKMNGCSDRRRTV